MAVGETLTQELYIRPCGFWLATNKDKALTTPSSLAVGIDVANTVKKDTGMVLHAAIIIDK